MRALPFLADCCVLTHAMDRPLVTKSFRRKRRSQRNQKSLPPSGTEYDRSLAKLIGADHYFGGSKHRPNAQANSTSDSRVSESPPTRRPMTCSP